MIYVAVFLHFFSDFYLQSREVAETKSNDWVSMGIHMGIIYIIFAVFAFFIDMPQWIVVLYVLCHGIQDKYLWTYFKKYAYKREDIEDYVKYNLHTKDDKFWNTLALDQCIHICLMIFLFGPYL